jgi:hypothetical protein
MPKPYREILVMACSRSGTNYTSEYLTRSGLKVGHERVAEHGAVGWPFVIPPNRERYRWGVVMHQVRHPLGVIASMATHVASLMNTVASHLGGLPADRLHASMLYWIQWNELIERETDLIYRVEDLWPHGPADLMIRSCLPTMEMGAAPQKLTRALNHREHAPVEWADLERKDQRASRYIYLMAHKYGYHE